MMEFNGFLKSAQEFWADLLLRPEKLSEMQIKYWQEAAKFFQDMPNSTDKCFQHNLWENNPFFHFLKQSYLFNANHLKNIVIDDKKSARKIKFMIEQWINAVSPTNFIFTNPEVLKEILETGGENLQKGFENFVKDINNKKMQLTDLSAFELGKNLAITPGKVIYQNDLMQLIHYLPTTEKVHEIPLLMIPPWINKYYILDLQPHNSLVKWAVDHGFTVYMVSWVNPDERHAQKAFDDYLKEGVLAAIDAIGEKEINALGFCIGGTLLACALAYLKAKKLSMIKSATYLAALVDFSDPGDLQVFLDEEQIALLENIMKKTGYLDGGYMSAAFNLLRSNDLIWNYYVNHYLKGKSATPFDILYWNSDSTNMPYKMHSQYLREMYLHNKLREPNGIKLCGALIDLSKVDVPTYCLATQQDHIAPWESVKMGMELLSGPLRFVLGESGHIAGIVNPPSQKKYGYYINETYHQDSWWNDWIKWLSKHSGPEIKARVPMNAIEDAPGTYVKVKL